MARTPFSFESQGTSCKPPIAERSLRPRAKMVPCWGTKMGVVQTPQCTSGGVIVKCYIFRTFQPFFFIISSRFYEIKQAVIKPVVRGPRSLSEFFF